MQQFLIKFRHRDAADESNRTLQGVRKIRLNKSQLSNGELIKTLAELKSLIKNKRASSIVNSSGGGGGRGVPQKEK